VKWHSRTSSSALMLAASQQSFLRGNIAHHIHVFHN
jgi:hypothetical protein